jgi:hypothetical protein
VFRIVMEQVHVEAPLQSRGYNYIQMYKSVVTCVCVGSVRVKKQALALSVPMLMW